MNFTPQLKIKLLDIGLVLLLCIPVIVPFFKPGYFPSHDGEWAVVRLADMYRTVAQDHQMPARYSSFLNAGYGYPLFNFAYPHPYYLGLVLLVGGFGVTLSIKILFSLSVIVSGFGMYMLSYKLWSSRIAGVVSALLYMYVPYRMVDLYVRGSLGESLSFALFPLLFYCALKIVEKNAFLGWVSCFGLLLGALIGMHNIMTVYFVPVLTIFCAVLILQHNHDAWKRFAIAGLLGISSAAYFWLPALSEKSLIWLAEIPIADRSLYFVSLSQLIIPSWGYGIPGAADAFTYQIGVGSVIVLAVACISLVLTKQRNNKTVIVLIFIALIFAMIFMMMRISSVIWESLPLLREINYPWTLLSQIMFIMPLIAGYVVTRGKVFLYSMYGAVLCAIILTMPYARPSEYVNRGDDFYLTNDAVTTSSDEYLPLWVQEKPLSRPAELISFVTGSGTVEVVSENSRRIVATVQADEPGIVSINKLYYPGWQIMVGNNRLEPAYDNLYGVMQIPVTEGAQVITASFSETPLRTAANIFSLSAIIILMIVPLPVISRALRNKKYL